MEYQLTIRGIWFVWFVLENGEPIPGAFGKARTRESAEKTAKKHIAWLSRTRST